MPHFVGYCFFRPFTNQGEAYMEIDMRRLSLHASVRKLIEGISIPENVDICYENMVSIFEEIDNIRHQKRRSKGTDWAKEALERTNLNRIGHFNVQVITQRKKRLITFTDSSTTLEFVFEYVPSKAVNRLSSVLKRASTPDRKEQEIVVNAFVTSVMQEGLFGKSVSPEELLLRDKPLALDDYRLRCVRLKEPYENLLRLSPFRRTRLIYTAPCN
jgi:hypothetical protein